MSLWNWIARRPKAPTAEQIDAAVDGTAGTFEKGASDAELRAYRLGYHDAIWIVKKVLLGFRAEHFDRSLEAINRLRDKVPMPYRGRK